jgi:hypothetical protein
VTAQSGQRRYLVADAGANRVAWINPGREHRSTYFAPWQGVDEYVRRARQSRPGQQWAALDLAPLRSSPTRVRSADRNAATVRGGNAPVR